MFLVCFHSPKTIIEKYGFDVELVAQTETSLSMHGSSEGHMGYVYRRLPAEMVGRQTIKCDPLFEKAYEVVNQGLDAIHATVVNQMSTIHSNHYTTRSMQVELCIDHDGNGGK